MVIEREGLVQFGGKDAAVVRPDIEVGDKALGFTIQAQDWSTFQGLSDTQGVVRIMAAVPSLETSVCDRETRRFNEEAAILIMSVIASKPTPQRTAGLKQKENQLPERRPDAFQAVVEGSSSCKTRCFDYGRILLTLRSARLNIRLHC